MIRASEMLNLQATFTRQIRATLILKENNQFKDEIWAHGAFFNDGERKIDFVLVIDTSLKENGDDKEYITTFVENLQEDGIEFETSTGITNSDITFIKLYTPESTLRKVADIYNIILHKDNYHYTSASRKRRFMDNEATNPTHDGNIFNRTSGILSGDRPTCITSAERTLILNKLLVRAKFSSHDFDFGLDKLMQSCKSVLAGYPIHDSDYKWNQNEPLSDRQLLFEYWGKPRNFMKRQPYDLIERYYGAEVGFYFRFLGFYTKMLIPASIMGILSFLHGIYSVNSPVNYISEDICNNDNITMCPQCPGPKICHYKKLSRFCKLSKYNHVFDNHATYIFAFIMIIWVTVCAILWPRLQNKLRDKWCLFHLERDNNMRLQYPLKIRNRKVSTLTGELEPYETKLKSTLKVLSSCLIMFAATFIMCIVLIYSVIIYRLSIYLLFESTNTELIDSFIIGSGALLEFAIIMLFDYLYPALTKKLTDLENPRTQIQYDNSYIHKIFILGFVNEFTILYYLAFVKGSLITYPGDYYPVNSIIGILRSDKCPPTGCIPDISIQLMIILLGKSCVLSGFKIVKPYFSSRSRKLGSTPTTLWEKSFIEAPLNYDFLVHHYKKIILQFGCVTIFSAIFPLAPAFALLYNILLIRIDAYKLTKLSRRPIPQRVSGIGAWMGTMKIITNIGIITNIFLMAYSTHFVTFMSQFNSDKKNFIHKLSEFAVDDFDQRFDVAIKGDYSGKICSYEGFRYPQNHPQKYELNEEYWQHMSTRLLIVIILESMVFVITGLLKYSIPNVPREVSERTVYEIKLLQQAREDHINKTLDTTY